MYTLSAEITPDELSKYAFYLFSRINESGHLPFKQVLVNGEAPLRNNCHENARSFVHSNSGYKIVFGWICIDGGLASPSTYFIAHSVIQDINGNFFEITPIYSTEPRPFLTADLSDDDFADVVNELERLYGSATLVHDK